MPQARHRSILPPRAITDDVGPLALIDTSIRQAYMHATTFGLLVCCFAALLSKDFGSTNEL